MAMMTEHMYQIIDELMHADGSTSTWTFRETDSLIHVVCECDENTALCGTDVSDSAWMIAQDPFEECVVCTNLDPVPCEKCGAL